MIALALAYRWGQKRADMIISISKNMTSFCALKVYYENRLKMKEYMRRECGRGSFSNLLPVRVWKSAAACIEYVCIILAQKG